MAHIPCFNCNVNGDGSTDPACPYCNGHGQIATDPETAAQVNAAVARRRVEISMSDKPVRHPVTVLTDHQGSVFVVANDGTMWEWDADADAWEPFTDLPQPDPVAGEIVKGL
jgi:hypothetical protein